MKKTSAGLLVYRNNNGPVEVLLGHPGGPFWAKKDLGAWSIPKGGYEEGEEPYDAAKREFQEEIGQPAPQSEYIEIGEAKLSNKTIKAWAIEGDLDISNIKSNTFEMEWPPRSGKKEEFPEIDKAAWFPLREAASKINKGQLIFLERLSEILNIQKPGLQEPKQQKLL